MKQRFIFIVCLSLFANWVCAQDRPFLKKCSDLLEKEEFEKVIQQLNNNSKAFESLSADDKLFFCQYLALANIGVGNLSDADKAYNLELSFAEKLFGKETPEYGIVLSKIGWFYFRTARFAEALDCFRKAEALSYKIGFDSDQDEAVLYDYIAKLNDALGNTATAGEYYEKAKKIYDNKLGKKHPYYLMFLDNLAVFYSKNGRQREAELYFSEVIQILQTLKKAPPYMNHLANDLGILGFQKQQYQIAEFMFSTLYDIIVPDVRYSYADMHHLLTLAEYYNWKEDYKRAQKLVLIINQFYNTRMDNNALLLNESIRESYWKTLVPVFELFNSIAINNPSNELIDVCYNNQLLNKAILLNCNIQIRKIIQSTTDNELKSLYDSYSQSNQDYFRLFQSRSVEELSSNIEILSKRTTKLETELIAKIRPYVQNSPGILIWEDVRNQLNQDEAAIEYISFNYKNTNEVLYCALLLKKGYAYPKLIPLFEEQEFNDLFVGMTNPSDIYVSTRADIDESRLPASRINYGKELYELVWKPVESYLKDTRKIYYAPSGKLQQIAFAAIPTDNGNVLMRQYDLCQLTSTREIVNDQNANESIKKITLFGGIPYDGFSPLKGTLQEVQGINNILSKQSIHVETYIGNRASEKTFKELNTKQNDVIHFATHGFYLPQTRLKEEKFSYLSFSEKNKKLLMDNPLLRSGLALAGAKKTWNADSASNSEEDGILTAQEISQLDLSGTKLVVLSACNTGLGDIDKSEGVFGLQRAFKLAGVQSILMSLWEIPDKATSEMMNLFYQYWLVEKMNKRDAFKKAQNKIRANNPLDIQAWAGFVMVD